MRPPRISARSHDRVPRQRRRRDVRPDLEALEGRIVLSLVAANPTSDTQLNTAAIDQTEPKVAMDAEGDYVVVWNEEVPNKSYYYDVEAKVYDAATQTLSSPIIVAKGENGDTRPSVAMDANGDFVVAWQVFNPASGPSNNYADAYDLTEAQEFTLAGATKNSLITIGSYTQSTQAESPQVAMDPAGQFVIAYQGEDSNSCGVFARQFNSSGAAQGSVFRC